MKYVDFIDEWGGRPVLRVSENFADKLQKLYPEIFCEENFEICWADEDLDMIVTPDDIKMVHWAINNVIDDLPSVDEFKKKWEEQND